MKVVKNNVKDKRITKEIDRLSKIFEHVSADNKALAEPLIENAAFLRIALQDLQIAIKEHGLIEEYKNGENQYGSKMSAEMQTYSKLIGNYAAINTKLRQLLPTEMRGAVEDDGEDFFSNFG